MSEWEQSIVKLDFQVPSAYPAMCGIHGEAKKKNFVYNSGERKHIPN